MTKEEINKAIAEYCGWEAIDNDGMCRKIDGAVTIYAVFFGSKLHRTQKGMALTNKRRTPNYSESLDAMHEAENNLNENNRHIYEVAIREVVHNKIGFWYTPHAGEIYDVMHATSQQRAEAFLKTIGKWI